ncbi:hypothetical protein FNF29_02559 [Cafeteria roenbergensis]|uniref:MORN repeat-containing protein 5 n=1 Tax=Cafeteria roenbergensis TaxID=33653 RepID=A0A5A8CNN3_CAFRO|nr:hypothetical protein FNF29_02559 [Cafeteria roenbergensis]|eukprot:KAA0154339.1 hypothetical protein FNF29_02559 [Cafeteria roenbergensis]
MADQLGHHTGSKYTGGLSEGRFEGEGEFTFPDGVVYRGGFRNGQFHGSGTMHFPDGSKYEAVWDNGTEITGAYSFKDGLAYDPDEGVEQAAPAEGADGGASGTTKGWGYLVPSDRRFHSERQRGHIEPAGQGWLGDGGTADVPEGCYDMAGGLHYDPSDETVKQNDTGKVVRRPDAKEKEWVLSSCRHAVSSGAGDSAQMKEPSAKAEVSPRAPGEGTPRPAAVSS